MRTLRFTVAWFPLSLAVVNSAFTLVVFFAAIRNPERSGMLPILVYIADWPSSYLAEMVRDRLHDPGNSSVTGNLQKDLCVYLAFGFIWYSAIGLALRAIIVRFIFSPGAKKGEETRAAGVG